MNFFPLFFREGFNPMNQVHLEKQNVEIPRPWSRRPSTMTLALEGEIGADELTDISAQLFRFARKGTVNVVIDFTDVTHLDYRLVRPLVERADFLRARGGDLKLSGLSPYLAAVLRTSGGADAFDTFATAADATGAFESGVFVSHA